MKHPIILKVRTGSHCHGTALPTSDEDIRGVCLPDIHHFFGIKEFEQHESPEGGEEDFVFYGFEKFLKLCCKGNLSALNILFVNKKDILFADDFGKRLLDFRQTFITQKIIDCIEGYCKSQLHRMQRGSGRCGKRQDIIEKHGYDTKFAYHAVMITNIGVEIYKTGTYKTLRSDGEQKILKSIRNGEVEYKETMRMIEENFTVMQTLKPLSKIPQDVDRQVVSDFCVSFLQEYFYGLKGSHVARIENS